MKGIRDLITRAASDSGLLKLLEKFEVNRMDVLRVLNYHRIGIVADEKDILDPSLLSATPEMFELQMQFLADEYHVLSLEDLLAHHRTRQPLPPRSVVVTFDDGYRDFHDLAWPILKKHGIPAILFVPTAFLSGDGQLFWWDRLYQAIVSTHHTVVSVPEIGSWKLGLPEDRFSIFDAVKHQLKQMPHRKMLALVDDILDRLDVVPETENQLLTWEDLARLSSEGLYVAAHTRSHPILSRISLSEIRLEVRGSQEDLKTHLGTTWPVFAYPVGGHAELVSDLPEILESENFEIGMTLIEGHNQFQNSNMYLLRRVGMAPTLSMEEFRLVLTRAFDVYALLKNMGLLGA